MSKIKEGYCLTLRNTQKTISTKKPNWQAWILFFLRDLQKQMKQLMKKIEYEKNIFSDLQVFSIKILEYAKEQGRVTMGDIVKLTG